jgi:hypothetical protein
LETEKTTTLLVKSNKGIDSRGAGGVDNNKRKNIGSSDDNNPNRKTFAKACWLIMERLAEEQKPLSISGLSRDAQVHRKTVEKCLELLSELEKNWFDIYRLRLDNLDERRKVVFLERRTGLLSYPEYVQNLIIKANHFPRPSNDAMVVIHLYLKDATSAEKAIPLAEKDKIVRRLEKQGQIVRKKQTRSQQQPQQQHQEQEGEEPIEEESLFYLSKQGIIVAKGALRVFPELKQQQ